MDTGLQCATPDYLRAAFEKVATFSAFRAREKALEECGTIARKLLEARNNSPLENMAYSAMVIEFECLKTK